MPESMDYTLESNGQMGLLTDTGIANYKFNVAAFMHISEGIIAVTVVLTVHRPRQGIQKLEQFVQAVLNTDRNPHGSQLIYYTGGCVEQEDPELDKAMESFVGLYQAFPDMKNSMKARRVVATAVAIADRKMGHILKDLKG